MAWDKHFRFFLSPYSLGKLIDWKLSAILSIVNTQITHYSLGKLIDWKPFLDPLIMFRLITFTPYSLGKLIDWKQYEL